MQLVVTLPDLNRFSAASTARWALFDAAGAMLREGEGAPAAMPLAERIVATVPATRIVFIETALPPVGDAKRDALLRYAIEDKLTIDPATVHAVVLGRAQVPAPKADGATAAAPLFIVAAIDRSWLRQALDWLKDAGRAPQMVITQTEAIEVKADEWRVLLDAAHATAKRPDGFAYSFDVDAAGAPPFALSLALREATAQARAPGALTLSGSGDLAAIAATWQAALGLPVRVAQTAASGVAWRPKTALSANFLQGEFAIAGGSNAWLTALRPAFAVLALIVLGQWLFTTVDWWLLERKRAAAAAANEQIFRATFPQAQTVVDAPLQMQRNVEELRRERGMQAADPGRANLARLADLAGHLPGFKIKSVEVGADSAVLLGEFDGATVPPAWNEAAQQAGARLETVAGAAGKGKTVTLRLAGRR